MNIQINSVNDAPVLAALDNVSFDEDSSGGVTLSTTDIDGDDLTYMLQQNRYCCNRGTDLSFSAPTDFNGVENFTVSSR